MGSQQSQGIHPKPVSDPLHAAQGQVPLAALETTHVCAMHAHELRERLLGKTPIQTVTPQVLTHGPLKIAFHRQEGFPPATFRSTDL